MVYIKDIQKSPEGVVLASTLDVASAVKARYTEVLDLSPVEVEGWVDFENGLYVLSYRMTYQITLPSSRSLQPVVLEQAEEVVEVFVERSQANEQADLVDEDLALIIDGDQIDLEESVVDNILMAIPLKVLTPDEMAGAGLQSGHEWEVVSEEDYLAQKAVKKEASNPFKALGELFVEESED